jgi:hypothetical protein
MNLAKSELYIRQNFKFSATPRFFQCPLPFEVLCLVCGILQRTQNETNGPSKMDGPFNSAPKAPKSFKPKKKKDKVIPKGANPKAFTYQSANSVRKDIQRNADVSSRRVHIPVRDR